VENYPGFEHGIMGPELMEVMKKQAARFGTEFAFAHIDRVDLAGNVKTVYADKEAYRAHALIICTGASARWLGIPSEEKFKGYGVSACATCDGFFFRDQVIVVVGGGDTALEEATFLTKFGSKVYLVHRRHELRASKAMQDRAFANPKIEFVWNSAVSEVIGDQKMSGVKLRNVETGAERTLAAGGLFIAIGHTPNTEIFQGHLDMDENGYLIVAPGSTRTNVPGVFAAGDVTDHVYRQAVTAAGMGCMAALDAERYLAAHHHTPTLEPR
jgi:thioredoxin reductase (NADPH)